ncbi:MAG: ribulose-phosphate 3-epimerase [Planctomycetes bacterium]|nr:ribulose-phosphate 3-epimerase [Planctomycetota bacterium]
MTRPILISPSILSADFANLESEVQRAESAGADWLHVDVMDGHFVPNLTIGPPVVAALKRVASVPLDVHLMISEPLRYAAAFAAAGAHVLTFHIETCAGEKEARATIAEFRRLGIEKVGVSLNPDIPIERVFPVLDAVDLVLVMSVFAGFGGQKFIPDVLSKTRALRARGFEGYVEMDGGLNAETIPACAQAGADVFVSGSALFGAPDMHATLARFRTSAENSIQRDDACPLNS